MTSDRYVSVLSCGHLNDQAMDHFPPTGPNREQKIRELDSAREQGVLPDM